MYIFKLRAPFAGPSLAGACILYFQLDKKVHVKKNAIHVPRKGLNLGVPAASTQRQKKKQTWSPQRKMENWKFVELPQNTDKILSTTAAKETKTCIPNGAMGHHDSFQKRRPLSLIRRNAGCILLLNSGIWSGRD